jgi:hypothetical protein
MARMYRPRDWRRVWMTLVARLPDAGQVTVDLLRTRQQDHHRAKSQYANAKAGRLALVVGVLASGLVAVTPSNASADSIGPAYYLGREYTGDTSSCYDGGDASNHTRVLDPEPQHIPFLGPTIHPFSRPAMHSVKYVHHYWAADNSVYLYEHRAFDTGLRYLMCFWSEKMWWYYGDHKVGRAYEVKYYCPRIAMSCTFRSAAYVGDWYDGWGTNETYPSNLPLGTPSQPPAPPSEQGTDLSGDQVADLAGLNANGHLYTYPGRGNTGAGTAFWAARDQGGTWGAFRSIALGDLNKDGIADLVGLNTNGHLYVYPGRGTAEAPAFWAGRDQGGTWDGFRDIALGDPNRDGVADLVGLHNDGHLYVYPGRGTAEAPAFWAAKDQGNTWGGFTSIGIGDLNTDGVADLVGLNFNGHLYVYRVRGNVNPGTAFWAPEDQGGTWGAFLEVTLGDLNGDGIADLAGLNGNGHLYVYQGRGSTSPGAAFWSARDQGGTWGGFHDIAL